MSPESPVKISLREAIAATVTLLSIAGASSYAYGVKSQQVQELQTIVAKHDSAIGELTKASIDLRIAVTELRTSIERRKEQ